MYYELRFLELLRWVYASLPHSMFVSLLFLIDSSFLCDFFIYFLGSWGVLYNLSWSIHFNQTLTFLRMFLGYPVGN